MVTTVASYTDDRYRAYPGEGYDGVVRVSAEGYYGSGALLYDGRAVLTAAHLLDGVSGPVSVLFETTTGTQTLVASRYSIHPDYDPLNNNHDLALVWLPSAAPVAAERYGLYRDSDELGQSFSFAGYGLPGSGRTGAFENYSDTPLRLSASNRFDADAATLKTYMGDTMGWDPLAGTHLMADFDSGSSTRDALGRLMYRYDTGLGINEGLIAQGDSGGPAFIAGQVAGVASYTTSLSRYNIDPDVDNLTNSSYGEIAAWMRVSAYQQWIDQSLQAAYANAPSRPEDVQKVVPEGDTGTSYAYFLLQFTGVRADPDDWLSVDYQTRDGTATAWQDYLPTQGQLILYPDNDQAVVAVEVMGDTTPEADEIFYLDVTNPVGGSFGAGVVKLTAMRTLANDDGWFL